MSTELTHTAAHLTIVAASLALFLVSGRAAAIARLLLSALLAIAAAAALIAAVVAPAAIAASTAYAPLAPYRDALDRVLGFQPPLALVGLAAIAALCAVGLLAAGRPARAATATAIAVLIAIMPFGVATAFPAPLFVAASLWLVSRSPGLLDDPAFRRRPPARHAHGLH